MLRVFIIKIFRDRRVSSAHFNFVPEQEINELRETIKDFYEGFFRFLRIIST